ncbi:MAG: helix-turn-helix domain-containing protein [Verrucomicrobia bacterium]|nr:helix-turn-helix domain-containing protein [Verrucomicrobiota bacterium]
MPLLKPQIICQSFSDFDELTEAGQGWNLELCKLDAVPFHGELFQLITEDFILSRGRFNCRVKQDGEPPIGFRTFAIPASESLHMLWRAQPVSGNDLMIFPSGGELHAFSEPGFDVFTLSIAESLLEKFVGMRAFQGLEVLHGKPDSMDRFRRLLHQTTQRLENIEVTKNTLLHQLEQLMTEARPGSSRTPHSHRIQTILHAERFVVAHPEEAPTVKDLCTATGASKRTLEYAFSNYLGIGPKTYINAVRLNGVHKQLRAGQPGQIHVTDAANHWGFWHMGQFAADYRKLFGENPSATLGCDAQPCKATCPFRDQCLVCCGA